VSEARGLFVSFEGVDGSGKSTQARLLAERLRAQGREVVLTREPGGSPGAEEIRRLVLTGDRARWSAETEILLFTAARRDHLERTIRPALARGAVVLTDRFADSTRLYQGATRGDLRALVDQLHALMIGMEPDLTVVIDMDPAKALARSLDRLGSAGTDPLREIRREAASAAAELLGRPDAPILLGGDPSSAMQEVDRAEDLLAAARRSAAEDRFEAFGLPFQVRIRQGFLDLAREHPSRITVIDGDRPESQVAKDVAQAALARLGAG
jgi:dTMP kinase